MELHRGEDSVKSLPVPESRMACYNEITPQEVLTDMDISLLKISSENTHQLCGVSCGR